MNSHESICQAIVLLLLFHQRNLINETTDSYKNLNKEESINIGKIRFIDYATTPNADLMLSTSELKLSRSPRRSLATTVTSSDVLNTPSILT